MFWSACVSLCLAAAPAGEKPVKPLPALAKEPKIDGDLKDLSPAQDFKAPESALGASATLGLKAAFRKDTLYVGITLEDDKLISADVLDLSLYFPGSGTTAKGVVYRFGVDGLRSAPAEIGAPEFAQAQVRAAVKPTPKGLTFEVAVPARALPRFQATKPMLLSLCVDYADFDLEGGEASKLTTCATGEMAGGPTRLPDELRKTLKLTPTGDADGIEARPTGWVAFAKLHSPIWALGDATLTAASLAELVAGDDALLPASVALPSVTLVLPDNRPIVTVLTGKNPYLKDTCIAGNELRMALYAMTDRVASRVLEWPAATCRLGRAMRMELTPEGSLEVGYTSGATHHFTWTVDHFERSELGLATPVTHP